MWGLLYLYSLLLLIIYIHCYFHNSLDGTKLPFMCWCAIKNLLTHLLLFYKIHHRLADCILYINVSLACWQHRLVVTGWLCVGGHRMWGLWVVMSTSVAWRLQSPVSTGSLSPWRLSTVSSDDSHEMSLFTGRETRRVQRLDQCRCPAEKPASILWWQLS